MFECYGFLTYCIVVTLYFCTFVDENTMCSHCSDRFLPIIGQKTPTSTNTHSHPNKLIKHIICSTDP